LQTAKDDLKNSLETARFDHLQALLNLSDELTAKKTATEDQKMILDTEIKDMENQKVVLANNLTEQKVIFETEAAAELQAKNYKLTGLQAEIAAAESILTKSQKAIAALKAKLE
jgi:hypothetical protein